MLPKRGEVWSVDFGVVGKVRPALTMSVEFDDVDRALFALVPHTTQVRGSRFEVSVNYLPLSAGAFMVQGLMNLPQRAALRRIGVLPAAQFSLVEEGLRQWLGL